jgi:hypothetical protein
MHDDELAEIVDNLCTVGADIAAVEVKTADGGLPRSLRWTPSEVPPRAGHDQDRRPGPAADRCVGLPERDGAQAARRHRGNRSQPEPIAGRITSP